MGGAAAKILPILDQLTDAGLLTGWPGLAGPLLDVVEYLLSFLVVSDLASISPVIAMLYSTAAALQFPAFIAVYLWAIVGLSAALVLRLRARAKTMEPATQH